MTLSTQNVVRDCTSMNINLILLINLTTKSSKIGIKRILMKPQYLVILAVNVIQQCILLGKKCMNCNMVLHVFLSPISYLHPSKTFFN